MAITTEEVKKIAKLARLKLTDEELALYRKQLGDVLGYIETLSEVDVKGVPPTSQVSGITNAAADDVVKPSLDTASSLANVPVKEGDYIKVKAVFKGDS